MVYVYAALGFAIGFGFGQMLLFSLLRGVSREKMLKDKNIQYKYGLLNWLIAILGALAAVALYERY